jgi:putative endonuclease
LIVTFPLCLKDYGLAGQPCVCSSLRSATALSMKGFHYVYILVSEENHEMHYSGVTRNLSARLVEHNRGKCPRTAKHRPWKIETAVAFRSEVKLAGLSTIYRPDQGANSPGATFERLSGPSRRRWPRRPKPDMF